MLDADKKVIEANARVNVLELRDKEIELYTQNCRTLGTVGAIMAGLSYYGLVRGTSSMRKAPRQ